MMTAKPRSIMCSPMNGWIALKFGLAIRAVAENPDAAALMGIDGALMLRVVSFLSAPSGRRRARGRRRR
jgi:ABC-type branched-subunit amino acid transport system permease subunit